MPVRKDSRGRWFYRHVVELPPDSSGQRPKKRIYGTAPRHCNTKAAAKQAMLDAIHRLQHPEQYQEPAHLPKKEIPTLREFVEQRFMPYTKNKNKHTEVRNKQSFLTHHLLPVFGDLHLDEIRPLLIEDYKRDKLAHGRIRNGAAPGLSKKTIDNHLILLRRILGVAKEWEIIERVPKVELFRPGQPPFDFFDFDEAEKLLAAAQTLPGRLPYDQTAVAEGNWGHMILVAIKTGMRIGELLALRPSNVHFQASVINVCEALADGIIGLPKSGKPRDLPVSATARNALQAQAERGEPYVFTTLDGTRLTRARCQKALDIACKRAGLRRVTWHVLRHTFASHLAMRGVPLRVIQELLGHATMEQTLRYAHLAPSAKQHAVDLLDDPPPPFATKATPKTPRQPRGSTTSNKQTERPTKAAPIQAKP